MKKVRWNCLLAIVALLCFSYTISAQQHPRMPMGKGNRIEQLKSEVDLSEAQVAQLETIQEKYKAQLEALKTQDFESPEARRTAFTNVMNAQKTEIDQVLTAEQKAQLQAKREARMQDWKKQQESRKELRSELKAYHDNTVLPTLRTQRAKLEEKISAEDKATIASLRTKFETAHQRMKTKEGKERPKMGEHKIGQGKNRGEKFQGPTEEQKADRETLKALVEKYKADIQSLRAEIEPQQQQWAKDMKAIHAKYRSEAKPQPQQEKQKQPARNKEAGKERRYDMGMTHFLLLNPAATTTAPAASGLATAELQAFPNPTTDNSTLTYTVKQAGRVRIVLSDEQGNVLKTLVDEYRDAGDYTLTVDLNSLKNGSYYYTLTDKQGITSKKVVVVK